MNGNNISKRDIRWLIYDIPCLILMLIIVVFAPHFLAHAAYSKKATHNANVRVEIGKSALEALMH